jgi:hypothetical protein
MSTNLEDLIGRSNTAGKPSAGVPGRLWFDTTLDKLQRDSGTDWEDVEKADPVVSAGGWAFPADGRLTLTTGVPVTIADVLTAATLYYAPYNGTQIALYDGSSEWNIRTFSELSLDVSGFTTGKNYDIWCYDNSGTPTLDSTIWTDDTTRATALTRQNGILVKTGATTHRYLGTIRMSAAGQTEDSDAKRFVINHYNKVKRRLYLPYNTAHTYNSGTWRAWNNDTAARLQFITLGEEAISIGMIIICTGTSGRKVAATLAVDMTNNATMPNFEWAIATQIRAHTYFTLSPLSAGFHYIQAVQSATDGEVAYGVMRMFAEVTG